MNLSLFIVQIVYLFSIVMKFLANTNFLHFSILLVSDSFIVLIQLNHCSNPDFLMKNMLQKVSRKEIKEIFRISTRDCDLFMSGVEW